MNATLSAKLLLIAGIAIQSTSVNAQTSDNKNNKTNNTSVLATNEKVNASDVKRQNAEAELEAMLERERQREAQDARIIEETTLESAAELDANTLTEPAIDAVTEEAAAINAPLSETIEEAQQLDTMMTDLSGTNHSPSFNVSDENSSTPYNFERPPLGEGGVSIPVVNDARVFAEFIDKFPAVVNYYTRLTEQEIINFYSESFGEPISQERKRERLTVYYLLGGISTRVVISEQDNQQQVDVIQEDSL